MPSAKSRRKVSGAMLSRHSRARALAPALSSSSSSTSAPIRFASPSMTARYRCAWSGWRAAAPALARITASGVRSSWPAALKNCCCWSMARATGRTARPAMNQPANPRPAHPAAATSANRAAIRRAWARSGPRSCTATRLVHRLPAPPSSRTSPRQLLPWAEKVKLALWLPARGGASARRPCCSSAARFAASSRARSSSPRRRLWSRGFPFSVSSTFMPFWASSRASQSPSSWS